MNNNISVIIIFLLAAFQANAFNCESQVTGSWNNSNTWNNCNNTVPQNDDTVLIRDTHTVSLSSATNNLESLFIEVDGDLDIIFDVVSVVTINANNAATSSIDLSNAPLVLQNNLTINANNKNILIGTVNGGFDLVLNSSAETHLHNTIGGVIPLKSLTTDSTGTTFFADPNGGINTETIVADEKIEVNDAAILVNDTTLRCGNGIISFASTIDSSTSIEGFAIKLSNNTVINFNDKIGSINELFTFSIFNSDGALVNINTSEIKTSREQRWDLDVTLNSPTQEVLMSSSAGRKIRFGKPSKIFSVRSESANTNSLTVSTAGAVDITSNIGDNDQALNNLFVNTPATITLSKSSISVANTLVLQGPVVLSKHYLLQGENLDIQSALENGGYDLTVDTTSFLVSSNITGVLSGAGDLIKNGDGGLDLASVNTTTGNMLINNGTISTSHDSENVIPSVPVISVGTLGRFSLYSDDTDVFQMQTSQTIKGTGQFNTMFRTLIAPTGAAIEPGFSPGILTAPDVSMQTGSQLNIELNGTTEGTDYDQLVVNDIDLDANANGGATLGLSVGFSPESGDSFTIIKSSSPISGTFNGLNEGARLSANGYYFIISYVGGSGNDVVLTFDGTRYYVNANSVTPIDGLSWNNAFTELQDALVVAQVGDEIWIAQGVYYPDQGIAQTDNAAASTFNIVKDVKLYGGFNGTESDRSQRKPLTNITVLSGDIDDNDGIDANGITLSSLDINGTNAYHVVTSLSIGSATVIDGVSITGGMALGTTVGDDKGAAIYCDGGNIAMNQLLVQGNWSLNRASLWACESVVNTSRFINNKANDVGGIGAGSSMSFTDSEFIGNIAFNQGTLFYLNSGTLNLTRVVVKNNYNTRNAAIRAQGTTLNFNDVVFSGNNSHNKSGVLELTGSVNGVFNNVTVTGNSAVNTAGAINSTITGDLIINNSILWNNKDSTGVGTTDASIIHTGTGTITLHSSIVEGSGGSVAWNPATLIDGGGNLDVDPNFVLATDPTTAPTQVGDAHLTSVSMAVDTGNNFFVSSTVDLDGNKRIFNGTVDMGAYEYFEEQVFKDGFE